MHNLQHYINASSSFAASFWTHNIDGLDRARVPGDLPTKTLAALSPLLRFFSHFDIVTLPNSREPKLFNIFHAARYVEVG